MEGGGTGYSGAGGAELQYIALLRGVNVNGHRPVRMDALRALVAELGYADVRTYIQSGNVLLRSADAEAAQVGCALEAGIARRLGLDVAVVVLDEAELAAIAAGNPFVHEGPGPGDLYVTLLAQAPAADRLAALDPRAFLPDRYAPAGRCVYVHCPNGFHRTKLTNAFFEARLGGPATTRNWQTVLRLARLAGEAGPAT